MMKLLLHNLQLHSGITTNAKAIKNSGVALVSGGGGYAVLSSDAIATAGLDVPQMPTETVEQLREFIPVAGTSVNNPIDTNVNSAGRANNRRVEILFVK